jgi:hypothetical protein
VDDGVFGGDSGAPSIDSNPPRAISAVQGSRDR